ncbi:MAG: zf-HC2 domain-containing protein, partial [Fimbriimonadaceae bacterium]
MSVVNLECQIAQAQIARHLAGESLPPEVLADLEAHLESCASCAVELERRRSALQAMLGGAGAKSDSTARKANPRNRRAPSETEVETPNSVEKEPAPLESYPEIDPQDLEEFRQFIKQKRGSSVGRAAVETAPARRGRRWAGIDFLRSIAGGSADKSLEPTHKPGLFVRPLIYSLALTGILIAMSTVLRDPTALFGERAIAGPFSSPDTGREAAPAAAESRPAPEGAPPSGPDLAATTSPAAVPSADDAAAANAPETTSSAAPTPEPPDSGETASTPPAPS